MVGTNCRLADRSDACEGAGGSRTEHMQQESGYVGGVPKMAAGAEAFLEDAGCWQASLQNARELLEAAGARERARVGGSGRRVDCPRAWLAPGSPEEGTTPRPAKEGSLAGVLILTHKTGFIVTKHTSPKCRPKLILKETSSNLHFENIMNTGRVVHGSESLVSCLYR